MARPTTKKALLTAAEEQYIRLLTLIDSMGEEEQRMTFVFDEEKGEEAHWKRDKNIRDVLMHLYEWQQLLLNWIKSNTNGEPKAFLPEPYDWKNYGEMNDGFWAKCQDISYEDSIRMLHESHNEVLKVIESFSNEELFEEGALSWIGDSILGNYCVSAFSSHYDWAIEKIKEQIKALNLNK